MTPRREKREAEFDLTLDLASCATKECPKAPVEAEFLAVVPDEVEDRANLALRLTKPSSELLDEEHGAIGWAQEEKGVDVANIDALVEKVDRKYDLVDARPNPVEGIASLRTIGFAETATALIPASRN